MSRIENGEKQFADMSKFLHERALIEEMYCNRLKEWSIKWGRSLEPGIDIFESIKFSF